MEAEQSSGNRRQPFTTSTNPFTKMHTRSNTEIYVHRNRSGRLRIDGLRHRNLQAGTEWPHLSYRRKRRRNNDESFESGEFLHISVKDLRARRVFSPALSLENSQNNRVEEKEKNSNDLNDVRSTAKETGCVEVANGTESFGVEVAGLQECGSCSEARDLDNRSPNPISSIATDCCSEKRDKAYQLTELSPKASLSEENIGVRCSKRSRNLAEKLDEAGGLVEEGVLMMALDAEIIGKRKADDDVGKHAGSILPMVLQNRRKEGDGSFGESHGCDFEGITMNKNKRIDSNFRCKQVLNRCSRPKVFKTPNSFSYRRLLPFLMDMAKDHTGAQKPVLCPETEKGLETPASVPLPPWNQETVTGEAYEVKYPAELPNPNVLEKSLVAAEISPPSGGFSKPESAEHNNGPQICDLQNESAPLSKGKLCVSNEPSNLETAHDNGSPARETLLSSLPPCSPVNHDPFNGEGGIIDATEAGAINLLHSPSPSQDILLTPTHDVGLKGILKRNPRGCRGLCTCLRCASFRLHAERAFEFSRNQMQDAEEIVLVLIKELTKLRQMMERSTDGANCHFTNDVNQVEEVCKNALGAEEVAKMRLQQMNLDLDHHCRTTDLQPPKVNFANSVRK